MLRLTFLLCCGIFLTMLIGGRDHGQQRLGLIAMAGKSEAKITAPDVLAIQTPPPDENPGFIPLTPVMVVSESPQSTDELPTAKLENLAGAGKILSINAVSANIRQGPGKEFAVLETLSRGESVLVVTETKNGWSMVKIEGDGIEGYIASHLLDQ